MVKKKLKNNNKSYVDCLYYDRCQIKLDSIEKVYLNGKLKENKVNFVDSEIPLIENILLDFLDRTDVRYFKTKHVNEVARNIVKSHKKKLSEDIGRNHRTLFRNGSCGNFKDEDRIRINNNGISSIDNSVDAMTGKHVLYIELENGKSITKTFNTEEELNLYKQSI